MPEDTMKTNPFAGVGKPEEKPEDKQGESLDPAKPLVDLNMPAVDIPAENLSVKPLEPPVPPLSDADPIPGEILDEQIKTAPAFSQDAASFAEQALAAKDAGFDIEDDAYLATRWIEYCRNTGSMGDWTSTTEVQKQAFRQLLRTVAADVRRHG
jgi:hypothetical protein